MLSVLCLHRSSCWWTQRKGSAFCSLSPERHVCPWTASPNSTVLGFSPADLHNTSVFGRGNGGGEHQQETALGSFMQCWRTKIVLLENMSEQVGFPELAINVHIWRDDLEKKRGKISKSFLRVIQTDWKSIMGNRLILWWCLSCSVISQGLFSEFFFFFKATKFTCVCLKNDKIKYSRRHFN